MPTAADRTKFLSLRARYQIASNNYDALDSALRLKYGPYQRSWLKSGERKKLESLLDKKHKLQMQFYELLQRISPRDWGRGIASWWMIENLTWEDAITTGPLSTMPVPSIGYSERDMRAFMEPVTR